MPSVYGQAVGHIQLSVYSFDVETDRAEAVVAADHGAVRILHPSVVEVSAALGQVPDKILHCLPGLRAETVRAFAVNADPRLALTNITTVLYRVLVFCHKVSVLCLADGGNLYSFHNHRQRKCYLPNVTNIPSESLHLQHSVSS